MCKRITSRIALTVSNYPELQSLLETLTLEYHLLVKRGRFRLIKDVGQVAVPNGCKCGSRVAADSM